MHSSSAHPQPGATKRQGGRRPRPPGDTYSRLAKGQNECCDGCHEHFRRQPCCTAGTGRFRWWDGTALTDQFSTPQVPSPYGGPYAGPTGIAPYTPQRPLIGSGKPVYNPLIWIITLLPLLTMAILLFWNPSFRVI